MTAPVDLLDLGRQDMAEQLRTAREDYEAAVRDQEAKRARLAEIENAFAALTIQAKRAQRPRYYQAGEPKR